MLPTIDIEARVNDGWLVVGVFAPQDRLDQEGLRRMIVRVREIIRIMEEV